MLLDILIVVAEKGGVENVINMTAGYLNQNGFKVRVVQLVWEHVKWVDERIEFYPLSEGREGHTLDEFYDLYEDFLLKHDKPDVVLATAWPMMSLVAKRVSVRLNVPYKVISWLHAPLEQYNRVQYGGIECLKCAEAVLVLNQRTATILREHGIDYVAVVHNPVDFGECSAIDFSRDERKNIAVFVGRLSVEKKVGIILQGLADAPDWKLLIIGDGNERETLEKLSYELKIENRVSFLGWQDEPWKCAKEAKMLILASEYEAFPMVAIEALASGIPVTSTPVDGIVEIIKPGINGYLFPHGDSKALAQILNMTAADKLPCISPQVCRESVKAHEKNKALGGFRQAILNSLDKISVIVPCYNVENRLRNCLDSILAQSIKSALVEIICIDDHSTDSTLSILQEYETRYPDMLMVVSLNENVKQGKARNIGLDYAGGNYVMFVDSDDSIAPVMLEKMYWEIKQKPCDYVECGLRFVTDDDISVEDHDEAPVMIDMKSDHARGRYLLRSGWRTACYGRLYQKQFLDRYNIRFAERIYMEDIYFSELCFLHCEKCIIMPQAYYLYYQNPEGTMFNANSIENKYMDTVTVQNMATQYAVAHQLLDECIDEYEYLHFSKAFVEPVLRMWRNEIETDWDVINNLKTLLLQYFPDILENPYVKEDTSEEMMFYKKNLMPVVH